MEPSYDIFDVAIVGAGVTGMLAAWHSVRVKRLRTLLIESRVTCGAGTTLTSGGSIGLQDKATDESIRMALEAIELYKSIGTVSDAPFAQVINWCGGIVTYWNETDRAVCEGVANQLTAAGVEVEDISGTRLRKLAPYMSGDIPGAFRCSAEGRIEPRRFAQLMLDYLHTKHGALLHWMPSVKIEAIEFKGGRYVLTAHGEDSDRTMSARSVLLATGAYHNEVDWPVDRSINPRRGIILTYDSLGNMDYVMHDSSYLARKESSDIDLGVAFSFEQRNALWRIGSSREVVGQSHDNLDYVVQRIRAEAERHIPGLMGRTLRSIDICFRPFELHRKQLIVRGQGNYRGVVSVNGQEGEGMTLAPALARRAVDLLTDD
ncbi:NAD(P)/FAD-dependent oxidoreductase [Herbidospora daliensis]|uniref:NAD(P)/FAD-dependent oxidoreductase n=1 Tax=Herbidospora daliensis TaxID=295585 RepID=UPI000784ED29|nr:FAD-dependent oxidoreductase [Herbidospora daliensis]